MTKLQRTPLQLFVFFALIFSVILCETMDNENDDTKNESDAAEHDVEPNVIVREERGRRRRERLAGKCSGDLINVLK